MILKRKRIIVRTIFQRSRYGNHRPAVYPACRYAAQPSLQAVPFRASAKADEGAEDRLFLNSTISFSLYGWKQ